MEEAPKASAPRTPAEENPEQRRSPMEAVANAADVLARIAANSELGPDRSYGVALAAQVLEDQLSIYIGESDTLATLSSSEKSSIKKAMDALESLTTQYELDSSLRIYLSEAETTNSA